MPPMPSLSDLPEMKSAKRAYYALIQHRAWWAALPLLSVVLLTPLLITDVPPLLDYPNHLARFALLAAARGDPVLGPIFTPHWAIIPNLAADVIVPPTEFAGRTAVVTGGGSGMGRELVRQLVAEACNVAMCDVSPTGLAETQRLCEAAGLPQGLRVTTHIADVAERTQVERFRDEVADRHQIDKIHLLFNNAGISGGGSMVTNSRDEWERTFNICWGGVYNCARAFLPMLQNAEEGHIVNTSSINGFWASVGPRIPHTAYSAAKFAVKGFTEALITDLRINAPHIKCSVVMPGQIGTSIRANTRKIHSSDRELDAIDVPV